jgi:hypothetical protein
VEEGALGMHASPHAGSGALCSGLLL